MRSRFARLLVAAVAFAAVGLVAGRTGPARHAATVGATASGAGFGDATDLGSMMGKTLAQPVVDMAATRSGNGYWLLARDGGVFSFGDAAFHGSTGAIRLNQPIVAMMATPSGNGYWSVAADGGVFSFGDAAFFGSTGAIRLQQPIVGGVATPSGNGYWLVARDGGVFSFGDAPFAGSAPGAGLRLPVSDMAATPSGRGYWLLADDGRVVPFGDATPLPASGPAAPGPAVAMAATADGTGYWAASATGSVRAFGAAPQFGAAGAGSPVVGMAGTPSGKGYWLVTTQGDVLTRVASAPTGSFGFLAATKAGSPMRYDPCQPVRYVVNPAGAPAGAVDEVRESFRRIGAATGIRFVDAGTTDETHQRIGAGGRRSYQPERYGVGKWSPILVSWASATDEPVLAGAVLGYGGSTSYWTSATDQGYITGEVVFDRDLSLVRPGFGRGLTRGNLVLHELGHVIGLDHVQDATQLMYPSISDRSPDGYAAGDLLGLARLGSAGGCLRMASPV